MGLFSVGSGKASLMFKLRFEMGVITKQGKGCNVHVCERMCTVCAMFVLWEDGQVVIENIPESIKEPCGGKMQRL